MNAPRTLTPEQIVARREAAREASQRYRERRALPVLRAIPIDGTPVVVDGVEFVPPRTRGDCLPGGSNESRPCPWTRCRHHNAVDINPHTGAVTEIADPTEMTVSCSLDGADREPEMTLEQVGQVFGVSRERIRQIESKGLHRVGRGGERFGWTADEAEGGDREWSW